MPLVRKLSAETVGRLVVAEVDATRYRVPKTKSSAFPLFQGFYVLDITVVLIYALLNFFKQKLAEHCVRMTNFRKRSTAYYKAGGGALP